MRANAVYSFGATLPVRGMLGRLVARKYRKTEGTGLYGERQNRSTSGIDCGRPSGVAVVEFAVVAPIFFLLILGLIEFGRMVMVQQVITNASREGARRAIIQGVTTAEVISVVQDYLASGGIRSATVTVTPDPIDSAGYGEPVTVTVSVPFRQVSWLPSPMFLGGVELRATTTMRREAVQ
ncbi:TadE/TadG family type IV pilus assembly protein [Thermogutta sp.]|uniref:TadE/TadG family type IV pilus assembly protein n=1 Tax=Thermogutta sp. TaxID=1962930 RepID=UPI0032202B57